MIFIYLLYILWISYTAEVSNICQVATLFLYLSIVYKQQTNYSTSQLIKAVCLNLASLKVL